MENDALTQEQLIRLRAMELTIGHYRGATVNAQYPTPDWLIQRAIKIEKYIKG
jgi:hypothetical protein